MVILIAGLDYKLVNNFKGWKRFTGLPYMEAGDLREVLLGQNNDSIKCMSGVCLIRAWKFEELIELNL